MSVGSHKAKPLKWLRVKLDACRPSIASACVLKHVCALQGLESLREYGAVVGTVQSWEISHVRHCPVFDHGSIESFVVDILSCDGERE